MTVKMITVIISNTSQCLSESESVASPSALSRQVSSVRDSYLEIIQVLFTSRGQEPHKSLLLSECPPLPAWIHNGKFENIVQKCLEILADVIGCWALL